MSVLFVFLDGIGLGSNADSNPFAADNLKGFSKLSAGQKWIREVRPVDRDELLFRPIDATLGIEGLPQSGTGQATLFTGVNCAMLAGRHYGPWPHSATHDVLKEHNMFRQVTQETGRSAWFANAYPDRFFEMSKRRNRWSTTTRCCLDAGLRINRLPDLSAGRALAADITGKGLNEYDSGIGVIPEQTAARRLLALSARHALSLFEYFHTDKAGHAQSPETSMNILESLSLFLGTIVAERPDNLSIVVTSDHGNMEDLSVKSHTMNDVPLAVIGPAAPCFRDVADLTGVTPAILASLRNSQLGQ